MSIGYLGRPSNARIGYFSPLLVACLWVINLSISYSVSLKTSFEGFITNFPHQLSMHFSYNQRKWFYLVSFGRCDLIVSVIKCNLFYLSNHFFKQGKNLFKGICCLGCSYKKHHLKFAFNLSNFYTSFFPVITVFKEF